MAAGGSKHALLKNIDGDWISAEQHRADLVGSRSA
jgi:hypothetical protein